MEVLPVTVPFQTVVEGLAGSAFGKLLADAQAACGRMRRRGAVEPAAAGIILAMPAQRLMDELDEAEGQARVTVVPGPARDRKQVADRERVRPQVALAAFALREPDHQPGRLLQAFSVRRPHLHPPNQVQPPRGPDTTGEGAMRGAAGAKSGCVARTL